MNFLPSNPFVTAYATIDLKYATIKVLDGTTPTPNELEIKIGEGNLTFTEARNIIYTLDRSLLDDVREGDQVPVQLSFDGQWEYMTASSSTGATPTLRDVLNKIGGASSWVSTDSDICRPYCVDIELEYRPQCSGSAAGDAETIVFPDFRHESFDGDLRAATFSVSGQCNVTLATVTRFAQT